MTIEISADAIKYAIILILLLGLFVVFLVYRRRRNNQLTAVRINEIADNDAFIGWLAGYEKWYEQSAKHYHRTLYWLRPAPIIIGFFVALVSAIDDKVYLVNFFANYMPKNIVVIFLTGSASACVAILTQLGIPDLSRTREIGRIDCATLVVRAKHFFSTAHDENEEYNEKQEIIREVFRIERDQASLFARVVGSAPAQSQHGPPIAPAAAPINDPHANNQPRNPT